MNTPIRTYNATITHNGEVTHKWTIEAQNQYAATKFAKRFMREQAYIGKLTIERDWTVRIK